MGVTGLWPLLEPVGRRISVEALQNKKLAVDASMWLFQFIRAMRDERGDLIPNAHILGFFRRICRLLFHRIRPVFVFDGSTPALKQQTVAARRRRREQQSAKLGKIAEKLLLNQLKQHALGTVVSEAAMRRAKAGQAGRGGRGRGRGRGRVGSRGSGAVAAAEAAADEQQEQQEQQQEVADAGAAPATATAAAAAAAAAAAGLPALNGSVAVAGGTSRAAAAPAAAPVAAGAAAAAAAAAGAEGPGSSHAAAGAASTAADELLAAQLAAEEWGGGEQGGKGAAAVAGAPAAAGQQEAGQAWELPSVFASRTEQRQLEQARRRAQDGGDESEESGDEGELEIVIPEDGQLDPAVMSTLPPSLQLDLMLKMREQKQAANRQQFEARRAAPASFSQFQMQQYLAATRFRRQVDEVKDAMNVSAAGGSAARRIAGEAGREYVLHKDPELLQAEAQAEAEARARAAEAEARRADAERQGQWQGQEGQHGQQGQWLIAAGSQLPLPPHLAFSKPAVQDATGGPGLTGSSSAGGQAVAAVGAAAAAATSAAGTAAHATAALACGEVLDICFDVELGPSSGDEEGDEMGWEDIDDEAALDSSQPQDDHAGQPAQHWRQRAKARQRYWSLSHGFQMGRKLAAWGEPEEEAEAQAEAEVEEGHEGGGPAAAATTEDADGRTPARKTLTARSPPSRSPLKPVPEEEDGQLQEAIRLSLAEAAAARWLSSGSAGDMGGSSAGTSGGEGSPSPQPTPAAAAAQLLEEQHRCRQQQQPEQQQLQQLQPEQQQQPQQPERQQQQPERQPHPARAVGAEVVDLTLAFDEEAVEDRAGGSGSDAEMLWEDAGASPDATAPAGMDGSREQQLPAAQQQPLLSSINQQSAERLEEWLGGGSRSVAAAAAAVVTAAVPAAAAAQQEQGPPVQVERAGPAAGDGVGSDENINREDALAGAEHVVPLAAARAAGAARAASTAGAQAKDVGADADLAGDELEWEDADVAAGHESQQAGHSQPLQDAGQQQAERQQAGQQHHRSEAVAGKLTEAHSVRHGLGPAPARMPAAAAAPAVGAAVVGAVASADKRVWFSDMQQVHVLQPPLQHDKVAAAEAAKPSQLQEAATSSAPAAAGAGASVAATVAAVVAKAEPAVSAARAAGAEGAAGAGGAAMAAAAVSAMVGGFTAAELEELAALEDDEEEWQGTDMGRGAPAPATQPQQPAPQPPAAAEQAQRAVQQPGAAGEPPLDFEAQLDALQEDEKRLRAAQRAGRGQTETPTQDMYRDCMELLTMFGLPYIIAPQEAEAQCAWLDANGLVDGVVTDDNDAFLFGARRVYRHIFESKRYVEEYRSEDIITELGVGRQQLAALAQLLGGDYCEGVAGVGIVNAMEVVHAFPGDDGLSRFREWLTAPDEQLVELARGGGRKPPRSGKKQGQEQAPEQGQQQQQEGGGGSSSQGQEGGVGQQQEVRQAEGQGSEQQPIGGQQQADEGAEGAEGAAVDPEEVERLAEFKRRHRGARRSWEPPPSFPSAAVEQAYMQPRVDASKDKFTFGLPDVELLRQFCESRFGWTRQQADELLLPVAQAYEQRQSQLTLDSFLTKRERFAKIKSKRLQKAVAGVAGGEREELMLQDEGQAEGAGAGGGSGNGGGRKRKAAGKRQAQEGGTTAGPDSQGQQQPVEQALPASASAPKRQRRQPAAAGTSAAAGRGRGRGRRAGRPGRGGRISSG